MASIFFYLFVLFVPSHSLFKDLYCGEENCYEVLNLNRNCTKHDISKAYRRLAPKHHPDRGRSAEERKLLTIQFQRIANAYEILKDEGTRNDYNIYIDNPSAYYATYYRYYRRRLAPKIDVRIVVIVTLVIASAIQYYVQHSNYNQAIQSIFSISKYRLQAMNIAKSEGLISDDKKRKGKKVDKEESKSRDEAILKRIISERMEIKGLLNKPSWKNVLIVQFLLLPFSFVLYIKWLIIWHFSHTICRLPYNDEEKVYLIRKYLKMGESEFETKHGHEKDDMISKELWIKENFDEWKEERDLEIQQMLAQSGRYKSYQRWLKSGAASQIAFDPE